MWLGRRRRGQSAIDFIARMLRADSANEIRTHSIASLGFPVVCEIVCQIINGIFARPCRSGSSGDGRKSFRKERDGKQRAGKHHPAHRVFYAAFPENRPVSVYKVSHGSLCHLGLLSGGESAKSVPERAIRIRQKTPPPEKEEPEPSSRFCSDK